MPNVLYEQDGAIALITLNRPDKMNAYNVPLHEELLAAIVKGDEDKSVRVMVITGAGKAFCAGADITMGFAGGGLANEIEKIDGIGRDYGGMLNLRSFECDTPIIAAVNGHAVGIGATMLLPWDIKIASSKAKFAFPFARRGIVFDGAASFFLPRIVGLSKCQEWIATGRIILADEALSAGMLSEVVEPDQVLERAMEIARDIAENVSPESMALNKHLTRASIFGDSKYGTGAMSAHMAESKFLEIMFASDDCMEGVQAFLEKRPPKFKDRG
jgi:enoyl-CoA hydratase/carnithine racemase